MAYKIEENKLFCCAKELVLSRHSVDIYSPMEDIFNLGSVVEYYSGMACSECVVSKILKTIITETFDLHIPYYINIDSIIKQPIILYNYSSMISEINKIVGIAFKSNIQNGTSSILASIESYMFTVEINSVKELLSYSSKGKLTLGNIGANVKKKVISYLLCAEVYTRSIAFGWLYMKSLVPIVASGTKEIAINELVHRLNKCVADNRENIGFIIQQHERLFVEKICQITFSNDREDIDIDFEGLNNYLAPQKTFYLLETEEIRHVLENFELVKSFESWAYNDELSSYIFFITRQGFKETISLFNDGNFLQKLICNLEKDLILAVPKILIRNVEEIPLMYSKYLSQELECPTQIWISNINESYLQKPHIQCLGATINTIMLVHKREPIYDSTNLSELLWYCCSMVSEMTYNFDFVNYRTSLHNLLPKVISSIFQIFSSTNVYSFSNIYQTQNSVKSNINHLSNIIRCLPAHYKVLATESSLDQEMYERLYNSILIEYIGQMVLKYLKNDIKIDSLYDNLTKFNFRCYVIEKIGCFERNMLNE